MSGVLQNAEFDRSGPHTRGDAFKLVLNGSRLIHRVFANAR